MNIRFLALAQQEVDDAVFWYGSQAEDKAQEFLDELDRAVRLIKSFPLAFTEIEPEIRRCLLARFPSDPELLYLDAHNRPVGAFKRADTQVHPYINPPL